MNLELEIVCLVEDPVDNSFSDDIWSRICGHWQCTLYCLSDTSASLDFFLHHFPFRFVLLPWCSYGPPHISIQVLRCFFPSIYGRAFYLIFEGVSYPCCSVCPRWYELLFSPPSTVQCSAQLWCEMRGRCWGFIGCGDCNWMRLAAFSLAPQCAAVDKSTEGAWEAALQSARHHNIKSQADKEGEKKIKERWWSRTK